MDEDKKQEEKAKELSLDLADKMEKSEISIEKMEEEIDNFLTKTA